MKLLGLQLLGFGAVAAWTLVTITIVFLIIKATVGLRVSEEEEIAGLASIGIYKVVIIDRITRYDILRKAMKDLGMTGMTVTDVMSCGIQKGVGRDTGEEDFAALQDVE